jgi:hypothetical protein
MFCIQMGGSLEYCSSCRCHCDWLVQTVAEAADAEEHETKGLDIDALVLGEVPDAMESDAELQV